LSGLRLDEQGLVERYPAALPKQLAYIRLKNLELRGKTVNVMISRTAGRVVRRVTQNNMGDDR
jgi:hypothetical protein